MDNGHGGFATAKDGKPYTTILYADGPGFSVDTHGNRADITNVDTSKTRDFISVHLNVKNYFSVFCVNDCRHSLCKRLSTCFVI